MLDRHTFGATIRDLAQRYGVTITRIQQILGAVRTRAPATTGFTLGRAGLNGLYPQQ